MGGVFSGRLHVRTPMGLLRGGVLLLLFIVMVGCTGGTPKEDPGKVTVVTPTSLPSPTGTPQPTPTPQRIALRSQALEVPEREMLKTFGVDDNWRPLTYITHDFEDQGKVVLDRMTGLMWQKSGSAAPMIYAQAQAYLAQLNQERLAGYADWRLPTMAELLSLLEPQAQANGLYLHPVFDTKQEWCWSADRFPANEIGASGAAWVVNFRIGRINWLSLTNDYVRAVRSSP